MPQRKRLILTNRYSDFPRLWRSAASCGCSGISCTGSISSCIVARNTAHGPSSWRRFLLKCPPRGLQNTKCRKPKQGKMIDVMGLVRILRCHSKLSTCVRTSYSTVALIYFCRARSSWATTCPVPCISIPESCPQIIWLLSNVSFLLQSLFEKRQDTQKP